MGELAGVLSRQQVMAAKGPQVAVDCDLAGVDLSRIDLSGWAFERCDLRKTKLAGATLEGARWTACRGAGSDFGGADLTEAGFVGCDFNNASFWRSTLVSARFDGCKMTGVDFSESKDFGIGFAETLLINARLPGFSFRKLVLQKVDFAQADLRKCDFRDAVFEDCSLREANLTGARFQGADLRGADLGGVRLVDAAPFRGATISSKQAGQLLGELGLVVR